MSEEEERPYKAEYAKSGRAGCKLCKGNISKDTLRMAKMVQVRNMWEGRRAVSVCCTTAITTISVL